MTRMTNLTHLCVYPFSYPSSGGLASPWLLPPAAGLGGGHAEAARGSIPGGARGQGGLRRVVQVSMQGGGHEAR